MNRATGSWTLEYKSMIYYYMRLNGWLKPNLGLCKQNSKFRIIGKRSVVEYVATAGRMQRRFMHACRSPVKLNARTEDGLDITVAMNETMIGDLHGWTGDKCSNVWNKEWGPVEWSWTTAFSNNCYNYQHVILKFNLIINLIALFKWVSRNTIWYFYIQSTFVTTNLLSSKNLRIEPLWGGCTHWYIQY